MSVKFGICTAFKNLSKLEESGFDYIELTTFEVMRATEEEFVLMYKEAGISRVSCEACNSFYPLDFHVVGNNIDEKMIYAYIDKAIERNSILGVRNITMGSAPARKVPEGFPQEKAFCQFGDQVRYAGKLAARYGMTVTIEPICPGPGSNLIINLAEGVECAKYVNLPNVKTMADINQMNGAGDTIAMIYEYGHFIGHLHTYDSKNHCYPIDPENSEQIALIKAYLTVNPGGRISVEGGRPADGVHHPFTSVQNARQCLSALKSYVAKA